jgi:ketosteroid isomerase-like protein
MIRSLVLFAIAVLVFAQLACQSNDVRPAAAPSPANAQAEKFDSGEIEKEITGIENDWPRVFREKDAEAVKKLYADDIMIIYADGRLGSKTQDVEDVENGNVTFASWQVLNVNVKVISSDSAIATGRTVVTGGKTKTADGKTVDSSGEFRWLDTFAKRDGKWKIIASSSVPLQVPIGAPSP